MKLGGQLEESLVCFTSHIKSLRNLLPLLGGGGLFAVLGSLNLPCELHSLTVSLAAVLFCYLPGP